jgi:T5SS/PEP-CTERM-associated repeat protein
MFGMAAFSAAIIGGAAKSHGQTSAIANGNWSDPLTWSAGEPAAATLTTINGGFAVTVDQAGEAAGILDLGTVATETGNLSVAAPGALTVSTTMRVGQSATTTGNVTMTGGTVAVNGAVGSGFGDGDLIVGDVGAGTWTQSAGDVDVADEIIIGLADVSTGVVNVSGGNFRANGRSILVGFDGNGTLNVSGTGNVRANFDMLVGFLEGGAGAVNLSGGTIEAGFLFTNSFTGPAGSTAVMTQTGGTFNARIAYVLGQSAGTTTMAHSGGVINVLNNGEFVVGDGGANSSSYSISGAADVNVARNFVVARDGVGVVNMTGGTIDATNAFLGDFDSSNGTMKISGGTFTLTGNLNVGAALASNAPPAPVGTAGQAIDADGTFIVSGPGGTIDVRGNLLANPDDNTRFGGGGIHNDATLVFEVMSTGVSTIDVNGIADLTGAEIDVDLLSGSFGAGSFFDLITATDISSDYLQVAEDLGVFSLSIVQGGNGEILRATVVPEPATLALAGLGLVVLGLQSRRKE